MLDKNIKLSVDEDLEMLISLHREYQQCYELQKWADAKSGAKERSRVRGLCKFLRIVAPVKAKSLWGDHYTALKLDAYPKTFGEFHSPKLHFSQSDFILGVASFIVWDFWNETVLNRKYRTVKESLKRLGEDCYSLLVLSDVRSEIKRIHDVAISGAQKSEKSDPFLAVYSEIVERRINWAAHMKSLAEYREEKLQSLISIIEKGSQTKSYGGVMTPQ